MMHGNPSDPPLDVILIIGTRPEAIKLAPVAIALGRDERFSCRVVSTGQHREILDQMARTFGLEFAADLSVLRPGQSLSELTSRLLERLDGYISACPPSVIVVQGDTTSTLVGALVAHYHDIPCVHIEAGLRTNDIRDPFPEEANRRVTSALADLHLAPTPASRDNLLREGIDEESMVVTGNTVIDALQLALEMPVSPADDVTREILSGESSLILVTSHRRESWGSAMQEISKGLATIARNFPDWTVVAPLHPNPIVRRAFTSMLDDLSNVRLIEPLSYVPFVHLMRRAKIILTDSGGIQEEAPSLGRPVLVMRQTTERPEAIGAGTARLVGTGDREIVEAVTELIVRPDVYEAMATASNPYGDGRATGRVLQALLWRYCGGIRPAPFESSADTVLST